MSIECDLAATSQQKALVDMLIALDIHKVRSWFYILYWGGCDDFCPMDTTDHFIPLHVLLDKRRQTYINRWHLQHIKELTKTRADSSIAPLSTFGRCNHVNSLAYWLNRFSQKMDHWCGIKFNFPLMGQNCSVHGVTLVAKNTSLSPDFSYL